MCRGPLDSLSLDGLLAKHSQVIEQAGIGWSLA
jgi:hypothetical protein